MIPSVITRMETEVADVSAKIERASAFLSTDTFKTLPKAETDLFREQISHMTAYRDVLTKRLVLVRLRNGL